MQASEPHTVYERQLPSELGHSPISWEAFVEGKGILVAGRIGVDEDVQGVIKLAEALGWPFIVDVQSQLHGPSPVNTSCRPDVGNRCRSGAFP